MLINGPDSGSGASMEGKGIRVRTYSFAVGPVIVEPLILPFGFTMTPVLS